MPPSIPHPRPARFSFAAKSLAALLLIALADRVFPLTVQPGAVAGLFAAAWAIAVAATRRAGWRDPATLAALSMAMIFAAALFDDPSLIALTLLWVALSLAALLPRRRFGNAIGWILPLLIHALVGPFRPMMDAWHIARLKRRPGRFSLTGLATTLALPVIGGALFVALFAVANPVISNAFARVDAPGPGRPLFWILILLCVWPALRPWAGTARGLPPKAGEAVPLPAAPLASVLLALATFNIIFAVQNGLDIAFLWSGARLPGSITLADYAHRGAYALIATALVAGALALWMLRPGSATAAHRWARLLLILWVAQNLMLVASSMLRTIDYVDAYSLTRLRIAALAWMVLVGIGLALICWRILAGKSATWLVNANLAAATALLTAACFVDLGAVAAHWNVRHAREVGGGGPAIDLCYLDRLGTSALLPLIEIEPKLRDPELRERVSWLRQREMAALTALQGSWQSWTWRGDRRLALATAALGPAASQPFRTDWRDCGGVIVLTETPPAPAPPAVATPDAPATAAPAPTRALPTPLAPTLAPPTAPTPAPAAATGATGPARDDKSALTREAGR